MPAHLTAGEHEPGYATDLLAGQKPGGSLTSGLGVPMVLVLMVLFGHWCRADCAEARRHDRKAARDGEAELEAYDPMLASRRALPSVRSSEPTRFPPTCPFV
jgi:cytochrome c oxidase assembly factor CtaG